MKTGTGRKTGMKKVWAIAFLAALMLASCLSFTMCAVVDWVTDLIWEKGTDAIGLTDAQKAEEEAKQKQKEAEEAAANAVKNAQFDAAKASADSAFEFASTLPFSGTAGSVYITTEGEALDLDTPSGSIPSDAKKLSQMWTEAKKVYFQASDEPSYNNAALAFQNVVKAYAAASEKISANTTKAKAEATLDATKEQAKSLYNLAKGLDVDTYPGPAPSSGTDTTTNLPDRWSALKTEYENANVDGTAPNDPQTKFDAVITKLQNFIKDFSLTVEAKLLADKNTEKSDAEKKATFDAARRQADSLYEQAALLDFDTYPGPATGDSAANTTDKLPDRWKIAKANYRSAVDERTEEGATTSATYGEVVTELLGLIGDYTIVMEATVDQAIEEEIAGINTGNAVSLADRQYQLYRVSKPITASAGSLTGTYYLSAAPSTAITSASVSGSFTAVGTSVSFVSTAAASATVPKVYASGTVTTTPALTVIDTASGTIVGTTGSLATGTKGDTVTLTIASLTGTRAGRYSLTLKGTWTGGTPASDKTGNNATAVTFGTATAGVFGETSSGTIITINDEPTAKAIGNLAVNGVISLDGSSNPKAISLTTEAEWNITRVK